MTPAYPTTISQLPHHRGLSIFYKMHYRAISYVQMAVPP